MATESKEKSVSILEKEFKSISNPNFEHYYGLANFYKDNEYHKESVKYYSLALNKIEESFDIVLDAFIIKF